VVSVLKQCFVFCILTLDKILVYAKINTVEKEGGDRATLVEALFIVLVV
jgi:hypothetical protein